MSWPVLITHDLLLVCVGLSLEIVFTAFSELPQAKDWRLLGYTYVWMIPIYALLYPGFCRLYPSLSNFNIFARGCFYMVLIFIVEYVSGWLIRKATGKCPWEDGYFKARWSIHGLIRLDFAPVWFGASLLYEFVFRVLRGLN